MKKYSSIAVMLVFLTCVQQKNKAEKAEIVSLPHHITQAEVVAAVDSLNAAIIHPEEGRLKNMTAEDLTYGHSSGLVQDREEFISDLIGGNFDFLEIALTEQTVHIYGKTAIVRHTFSSRATNKGEPAAIKIGNLLVFQVLDGKLKLIARQAFKL
ncbi:MAG: nuclear transport factor 2 family protein [Sediminicola sp.]